MHSEVTGNWWGYNVDPARRHQKLHPGLGAYEEVDPESGPGLDYASYLQLDRLLAAQAPVTTVPDERIFIITHQLAELVFKQMIFDLGVITTTLELISGYPDDAFHAAVFGPDAGVWTAAATAAARLEYSSGVVIPRIFQYLDFFPDSQRSTFSSSEFAAFRESLRPASGFQTAQFRLIQRAFGKGALLGIRLFPTCSFAARYGIADAPEVANVTDRVILREQGAIANPEAGSGLNVPERIETAVDHVLERIAHMAEGTVVPETGRGALPLSVVKLQDADVELAVREYGIPAPSAESVGTFRADLRKAMLAENARREQLARARAGANHLRSEGGGTELTRILDRLVGTDAHLHGKHARSLLTIHFRMASRRISEVHEHARLEQTSKPSDGTAEGGPRYLQHMRTYLIPLFPGFVAYSEDHLSSKESGREPSDA